MRKFRAYWGKGYVEPGVKIINGIDSFDEDNGYDFDAVKKIENLKVGEIADLSDLSGIHTIKRLK